MSPVRLAPTLATMAEIYRLPRDGGPTSERFQAYVSRVTGQWGLVAYNPMAGSHALDTILALEAVDAESVVLDAATATARRAEYDGPIVVALAVMAAGMWTDRLATEVRHRTVATRTADHGLVMHWSRDPIDLDGLRREAAAETTRTIWTALRGSPATALAILEREGLAYAADLDPFGPLSADEERLVSEAVEILGPSTAPGDVASILYGDPTAEALGWSPLGIPDRAGFRWAVARARSAIAIHGWPAALRRLSVIDA